jgi:hypothetical protein
MRLNLLDGNTIVAKAKNNLTYVLSPAFHPGLNL